MFRSLLIAIDLSPSSSKVLDRAITLPLEDAARVSLLHVVPRWITGAARASAVADAKRALQRAAREVSARLKKGVTIDQIVKVGRAATEIAKSARGSRADLVLVGRGRGRPVREAFIGSTAERVLRAAKLPTLLVRRSAHGLYRKPLLAVDADEAAHRVLAATLRIIADPPPHLSLVRAYEVPYEGFVYSSLSKESKREYHVPYRRRALDQLTALMQTQPDAKLEWTAHVRHGSARTVIANAAEEIRCDLLALGTHGYAGVTHALLGTVAGDVLREVSCDVLVVPPRASRMRRS